MFRLIRRSLVPALFAALWVPAQADTIYYSGSGGFYGAIYSLDTISGAVSTVITGTGSGAGGNHIDYPIALAMGPDGNLYVGNANNGDIVKVTPGGVASDYFAVADPTHYPHTYGLAFGPTGNLYAANLVQNQIVVLPPGGGVESNFVSGPEQPATLRSDPAGNIYVVLANSTVIERVTLSGIVDTFTTTAPGGLIWSPGGDLYESTGPTISKTTASGDTSTFASGLVGAIPFGINSDGDVFVYDTMGHYTTGGGTFYQIAPTGEATAIADAPFALDFVVVTPEPNLCAVSLATIVAVHVMRRHRRIRVCSAL